MSDIAMCTNDMCTLKEKCYRHTAPANEHWQSYGDFKQSENGNCDDFWNNEIYLKDEKDRDLHTKVE